MEETQKPSYSGIGFDVNYEGRVARHQALVALKKIKAEMTEREKKLVAVQMDDKTVYYTTADRVRGLRQRLAAKQRKYI